MTTAIYETKCWGEIYRMRADFSQAASPIEVETEDGEYAPTQYQVADFSHCPTDAMRAILDQSVIDSQGDPSESVSDIDDAIAAME